MRDLLNKSLPVLIWITTGFLVIFSCYSGVMVISYSPPYMPGVVLFGFLYIFFGVTMSFVFAGISFMIMDVRAFTKHMAINQKKGL